jgi:hypothetical protein
MANAIDRIDVVATVIYCQGELLTISNPNWGAFTLPMTKLRTRPLGLTDATRWELGEEAAVRNVAECLGITSVDPPLLLADFGNLSQSDRSGQVNHYVFQVYGFPVDGQQVGPGITAQWLTTAEILNPHRQPVSPTARELVKSLSGAAALRNSVFPPPPAGPPRPSVSSVAMISRLEDGNKKWLCQWNPHWERYFLVAGHKHDDEKPEECMIRELKEELVLIHGQDYQCQFRKLLEYEGWSTSAWQMTQYSLSAFDVRLGPGTVGKVKPDPANRWITAQEIRSERCTDDKLISPTARKILELLGEL